MGNEAFQQYEEEIAKIDKQAHEARKDARRRLWEQLKTPQTNHHKELKRVCQRINNFKDIANAVLAKIEGK